MGKNNKPFLIADLKKNQNSLYLKLITGYSILLSAIYLISFLGDETANKAILLPMNLVLFIPLIYVHFLYKKKPDSKLVAYLSGLGFIGFYCFILLMTANAMVCMYVIAPLILFQLFEDSKLFRILGISAVLANIIDAVAELFIKNDTVSQDIKDSITIQILGMILIVIAMMIVTAFSEKVAQARIADINASKDKVDSILDSVKDAAARLSDNVENINAEAKNMEKDSQVSKNAIDEIVNGTAKLNDNIQSQLQMSENISSLTETAKEITASASKKFDETQKITEEGYTEVNRLGEAADMGKNVAADVDRSMNSLVGKTAEAAEILQSIQAITRKTSMLALNASIEAARAGDAGRGFAVVAEEIKSLAGETQAATERINLIFSELEEQTGATSRSINTLLESNNAQSELVEKTGDAFNRIRDAINEVSSQISQQNEQISKVASSNAEISTTVESMSGFSGELLSNTEDTRTITNRTIEGTANISRLLDNVVGEIHSLEELVK